MTTKYVPRRPEGMPDDVWARQLYLSTEVANQPQIHFLSPEEDRKEFDKFGEDLRALIAEGESRSGKPPPSDPSNPSDPSAKREPEKRKGGE